MTTRDPFIETRTRGDSGQVLIIAIMVLVFLLLSVPLLVFQQSFSAHSGVHSKQSTQATQAAEAGISQAVSQLSTTYDDWRATVQMDPAFLVPMGYDGGRPFTLIPGARYTIQCSTGNKNLSNTDLRVTASQVRVIVRAAAVNSDGKAFVSRAAEAVLGPRTVGAEYSSEKGAPAALALFQDIQNIGGDLDVEWGPVVFYHATDITGTALATGHPRKFDAQGLSPFNTTPTGNLTDNREFWSFQDLAPAADVDVDSLTLVANKGSIPDPVNTINTIPAYINGDVTFGSGYVYNDPNAIIVVHGNVEWNGANIQVSQLIVDGDMIIVGASGGQFTTLRIPRTAAQEYPGAASYFCSYAPPNASGDGSQDCDSAAPSPSASIGSVSINLKGFLYVSGNLTVDTGQTLNIAGVVRVGGPERTGQLILGSGSRLRIFYDDSLNRAISVTPFMLWREDVVAIPAS